MQSAFEPVCFDLRRQIKDLQNEFFYKQVPVHVRMKRYRFKRRDDGNSAPNQPLPQTCLILAWNADLGAITKPVRRVAAEEIPIAVNPTVCMISYA